MKKIFVSLALIVTVGLTTVFATDEPDVSNRVKQSLKKEFVGAMSITWSQVGDYQRALFVLDAHRVEAYFNADGEMLGFARGVLFNELPMVVSKSLDKRFPGADFIDAREVSNADGVSYWLTVETAGKSYRVKVDPAGSILNIAKDKK
jgi:hypothetical protein